VILNTPDITTKVGSISLNSPLLLASGTAGYADEMADFGSLDQLGAVVVKSLTCYPWPGNNAPRLMGVTCGMVNSVGLQGDGLQRFLEKELKKLISKKANVIISVWGQSIEDFQTCADLLKDTAKEVLAVELNLSCPNLAQKQIFAHDPELTAKIVSIFSSINKPIWAKLSPNSDNYIEVAKKAVDSGADAISAFNTLSGMAIEIDDKSQPKILLGGLSGKALKPVSLRGVYLLRKEFKQTGIIGIGGVSSLKDVLEYLAVGADAVGIGTANLINPRIGFRIVKALKKYLEKNKYESIEDLKLSYRKSLGI
jgi:dihydroorotate dehydrogenase (NAD+) catalytic subunit